ncbi:ABC transporter permease [Rossellomorea vietnamensis]|uniref:ABC transporter permease n=1 Tax=Rossellomorea vietnamensis TaxID=218284 RepID=A0ACD4CBH3_9BACI|nr:ABC transporter permease [Rossellomorea vietnamensis]UXH45589.1 ABC transporter permease [Rossellomorea vietnamensis]WQI96968.1 ABC transporter permease [Rossellomorea vietnamensis]
MKQLLINPMLNKEFKLRFRSFKAFIGMLCYLIAVGIVVIGFIYMQTRFSNTGYFRPEESRVMFMILSFLQLALVLFITPGLTGGVISGEREKQTLSMLLTTEQSSMSIILSKLVSSVSYLLLLVISSLPLYSFVFLFGGVSPSDLLTVFGYSLFLVFTFGSIGVFYSTVIRKTIVSMVTTYATVLFLVGGTLFLFMLSMAIGNGPYQNQTTPVPYLIAMFNPAIVIMGHFEPMAIDEIYSRSGITFPLWISFLMIYSIVAVISLSLSIMKLRPSMKVKSTNKG